jgi:hypothetical protein
MTVMLGGRTRSKENIMAIQSQIARMFYKADVEPKAEFHFSYVTQQS